MEENNNLGNNTNGSLYGSSLYGTEPQPETTDQSSVYGQPQPVETKPEQPQPIAETAPEQPQPLAETAPEQPQPIAETAPEQPQPLAETAPEQPVQEAVPEPKQPQEPLPVSVQPQPVAETAPEQPQPLAETAQATEQPKEPPVPVSLEKTPNGEQPQAGAPYQPMGGQPQNGGQQGFYGQPVFPNQPNGYQPNYNGQPMGGNPAGGNPVNGYPPNYNGQQMNPNYPMNGYQPNYNGQQILPCAQPKKRRTGLIIGLAVGTAVVVMGAAGILLSKSFMGGGAKQQFTKGMINFSNEMAAYSSGISQDIDIVALQKLSDEKPMHANIDLSFTDPEASGSFDNVSVEIDAVSDAKNKQEKFDVKVGTYGFDMDLGSVVADDNTLYFSSPLILQDDVYSLDLTNLGKDFNSSAWAELLETTIPEDGNYTLFDDDNDSAGIDAAHALELGKIFEKYSKGVNDACTYTLIKEKREFPYGGELAAFGGVQVTADKDAVNAALENIKNDILSSDFYTDYLEQYKPMYGSAVDDYKEELDTAMEMIFGMRYEQDPVFQFYLDKKGRIINISTPEDIAVSSQYSNVESIAVDIDFGGDERALDSIEGGIYIQAGGEILYLGISRTAYVTEDFYSEDLTIRLQSDSRDDDITFYYGNDWGYADKSYDMKVLIEASGETMALTADGSFENIVKGEGYTFRVNNGALTMDDEDLLLMSGVISIEPADSGDISIPENAIDVLKMSRQDIMGVIYNAVYSLQ